MSINGDRFTPRLIVKTQILKAPATHKTRSRYHFGKMDDGIVATKGSDQGTAHDSMFCLSLPR